MSLKVFHLFFIAASALLCAWVGAWGLAGWMDRHDSQHLALAVLFVVLGIGLVIYGTRVLRKFRDLHL